MLSPYPEYTKQTRCNNDLKLESKQDFFRPMISNQTIPLSYNHEHYITDHLDIERSSMSTRNNCTNSRKPVQTSFQQDYYMASFDKNYQEDNILYDRNPVNTRRDVLEKVRNEERKDFMKKQGGNLSNFTDFKVQNTRENKNVLNR